MNKLFFRCSCLKSKKYAGLVAVWSFVWVLVLSVLMGEVAN